MPDGPITCNTFQFYLWEMDTYKEEDECTGIRLWLRSEAGGGSGCCARHKCTSCFPGEFFNDWGMVTTESGPVSCKDFFEHWLWFQEGDTCEVGRAMQHADCCIPDVGCRDIGNDCCAAPAFGENAACIDGYHPNV